MTHLRAAFLIAALTLVACGTDAVDTAGGESGPTIQDISEPVSEQDVEAARHTFDAAKDLWDSFEPFAHTMTIGLQTVSEVRISFDADGNVLSEEIVRGDPDGRDTDWLPRTVVGVLEDVDETILAFEDGRHQVPDEGECGHHFNIRFDPNWGVPASYDGLGPCDDGVGVVITITNDEGY